jgi:hypothetical protein
MISLFDLFHGKSPYYLLDLAHTVNALPGVKVEHAFHHSNQGPTILFSVDEMCHKGLFFLTRCIDKRYFKWGNFWDIKLSVGDQYCDKKLPIIYELSTTSVDFEKSIKELVDNLNYHFHHENFMEYYELKKDDFKWIDTVIENRNNKINQILI